MIAKMLRLQPHFFMCTITYVNKYSHSNAIRQHHHDDCESIKYICEENTNIADYLIPPTPPPRRLPPTTPNTAGDDSDGAGSIKTTTTTTSTTVGGGGGIDTTNEPSNRPNISNRRADEPPPKSAHTIWDDDDDNDDIDYADTIDASTAATAHIVCDRRNSTKRNRFATSLRLRRIASGLRLAHSQALAVAGFLPDAYEAGQPIGHQYVSSTSDLILYAGGTAGLHSNSSSSVDNTTTSSSVLPVRCGGGGVAGNGATGTTMRLNQRSSFHGRGQTFKPI